MVYLHGVVNFAVCIMLSRVRRYSLAHSASSSVCQGCAGKMRTRYQDWLQSWRECEGVLNVCRGCKEKRLWGRRARSGSGFRGMWSEGRGVSGWGHKWGMHTCSVGLQSPLGITLVISSPLLLGIAAACLNLIALPGCACST